MKNVHAHINGTRPDGVEYRALDPELIGWVHTCIPWAVMEAYHRYGRPLSTAERDRYLAEQAPLGRMAGAEWVPESMAELEAYVERMRPLMSMNEQTRRFIDFLAGDSDGEFRGRREQQLEARLGLAASMSLDADVGPPPHRHLPAGRGATRLPRTERTSPGPAHPLGLPRGAVQDDGDGSRVGFDVVVRRRLRHRGGLNS